MARPSTDRREFLRTMGSFSLGLAVARGCQLPAAALEQLQLPQVPFGKASLSRLICGSNCFNAGSHLSNFANNEMRAYYTPEQILKTLRRCQEAGINTWQISSLNNLALCRRFLDEGGQMQVITLGRDPAELPAYAKGGCLGVAHHGEFTDNLFKAGKVNEVRDFLKKVRDARNWCQATITPIPSLRPWQTIPYEIGVIVA